MHSIECSLNSFVDKNIKNMHIYERVESCDIKNIYKYTALIQ